MSEWWTYRPSDFLMFSARTWGRVVTQWNADAWPAHVVCVALGIALLLAAWTRPREAARWGAALLAVAWAVVAWAFLWQRRAAIDTAGSWIAAAWAVQAVLLAVAAVAGHGNARLPDEPVRLAGMALLAAAIAFPLLAPALGQPWQRAEVVGLMPEPTALATVGLLLATPQRVRAGLLVLPVLSLAVGAMTAWLLAG